MQPKKLEQYKYFAPIAWTVCISFAAYVGLLAVNLDEEITRLENSSLTFENRLNNLEKQVGSKTVTPAQ